MRRAAPILLLIVLGLCLAPAAGADWRPYKPPAGKNFFGVSDNGRASGFRNFARTVGKHPAVIETFHPWGTASTSRSRAGARPAPGRCSTSTPSTRTAHEVISPRSIAVGGGDEYLLRLNRRFAQAKMPRLHPAAGRAEPLPQRLGGLRLRRQRARRRLLAQLVQAGLPPHRTSIVHGGGTPLARSTAS